MSADQEQGSGVLSNQTTSSQSRQSDNSPDPSQYDNIIEIYGLSKGSCGYCSGEDRKVYGNYYNCMCRHVTKDCTTKDSAPFPPRYQGYQDDCRCISGIDWSELASQWTHYVSSLQWMHLLSKLLYILQHNQIWAFKISSQMYRQNELVSNQWWNEKQTQTIPPS